MFNNPMTRRRPLMAGAAWLGLGALLPPLPAQAQPAGARPAPAAPQPLPPMTLRFPRDHGSHPQLRTEWWYVTGQLRAGEREFGFQVTFFRTRVDAAQGLASKFAAKQLLFAHAAVTDVQGRKLWHDQRIARAGFEIAQASEVDGDIRLRDWSLRRTGAVGTAGGSGAGGPGTSAAAAVAAPSVWQAQVTAGDFSLQLACTETQPLLLQGQAGLSRKGPQASQASYYYSLPQLAVRGSLSLAGLEGGRALPAQGKAWLDHEWSQALMHGDAVGWDWIGINLDDGSALTAFRLRRQDGSTLWDGGSFRAAGGSTYVFSPGEVLFSPRRHWKSPLSQASYPVEWIVRTPADFYAVRALVDNQELDSRNSTGAIYWEGLCELADSNGNKVGRGYLEMTGYAQPLRL